MKSAYYVAVVTNAYRMAIDSYLSGDYKYDPLWLRELESVSHREYNTGYYFADSHVDANTASTTGYLKEKSYLCVVEAYDDVTGLALCTQRNKMSSGEPAELLTPGRVGVPLVIGELYDADMNPIPATPHPYMKFYMKAPFAVKAGDILRAV